MDWEIVAMDKFKNAAIILLGLGEKCAATILKGMTPPEVQSVIEAINKIDDVTEIDVVKALNEFFKDSNGADGIDLIAKENIKNSIISAVENGRIGGLNENNNERSKWIEYFKWQPLETIMAIIQEEHPQIIAVIATVILNNEKASKMLKSLPKPLQTEVIHRMTHLGPISNFAMEALSIFFESQLITSEKYNDISVDGVECVANIISFMDSETEKEIMDELSSKNKTLTEKIQEKILPFERLADLDSKSLQILLKEVSNEDLALALKGADEAVKNAFFKNMSQKSAEILKDDMEAKGPVKIMNVVEAQKRIIVAAKKLHEEEKIILSIKSSSDVVY
jgi:flagellar motor switch protein FliG